MTLASLLVLAIVAAWWLPRLLDWDEYRQNVAAIVSAGLGRPVRIKGPIRLSLLPGAILRAGDIMIADTGDGASATASSMQLRVGLAALLAGQVHPRELVLQGAHMHLPWPISARFLREGRPTAGLHAQVEDSTLDIGGFALSGIGGELAVDPATGTLSASGIGTALGRSWRLTGRLGRPGQDGSATVELSLDGQGALINTGGLLSGLIAADGGLSGRITARGPDLSLLLPAPALPWRAAGRLAADRGLALADDLEAEIGGSLARGALALRFLPKLRLDAAMATSRLDLDRWLPALLHGEQTALPTGIDVSAGSATLAGGTLRRVRAGFDLATDGVVLRDVSALLPGDADLHVTGRLQGGQFNGAARLAAPQLRQTLDWLRPQAPGLLAALPPRVLQSATLAGTVTADSDSVTFGSVQGQADGAPLTGSIAFHGGGAPRLAASIKLTSPVLDPWLTTPPADASEASLSAVLRAAGAAAARLGALRTEITLEASQPMWLGTKFDRLSLGLQSGDGSVALRQAVLTQPDLTIGLSGTISSGAVLSDGRLDVRLGHASVLVARLPRAWRSAEALFRGPATLQAIATGPPAALHFAATSVLSGAELRLDGVSDLPGRQWSGGIAFRHPGAPRLLEMVGLPGSEPWLGDGSLSLQADVAMGADRLELGNIDVAAGSLRATADLAATGLAAGQPVLTGRIKADTLPLPLPYLRSPEPWLRSTAQGWSGRVMLQAGRVLFGLSPGLENLSAALSVDHGNVELDDLSADLSGGRLTGQLSLTAASPPHLTATAQITDVALLGPLFGSALDLSSGRLNASAALSASGYSPAGLLATLGFTLQATVRDGTIDGADLNAALAALPATPPADPLPDLSQVQTQVQAALQGGSTRFSQFSLAATANNGGVTLSQAMLTTPLGELTGTGTVDLLTSALLARFALQPAAPGAPAIGLRLSGSAAAPSRTPELGDLAQWLAGRRG